MKKQSNTIQKLHPVLRNPYFISLVLFLLWMLFVDENDFITQYRKYAQLQALKEKRIYYLQQIKITNQQYAELTTNPASQEKFAREQYRMKRDNEDVFVIVRK